METNNLQEQPSAHQPWIPMRRKDVNPEIMDILKVLVEELPILKVTHGKL